MDLRLRQGQRFKYARQDRKPSLKPRELREKSNYRLDDHINMETLRFRLGDEEMEERRRNEYLWVVKKNFAIYKNTKIRKVRRSFTRSQKNLTEDLENRPVTSLPPKGEPSIKRKR